MQYSCVVSYSCQQYDALVEAHPSKAPSQLYGAEHLLRLFGTIFLILFTSLRDAYNADLLTTCILCSFTSFAVRMPKLLSNVCLPPSEINQILAKLTEVIK